MKILILILGLSLLVSNSTVSNIENNSQYKNQNGKPDYKVAVIFINDYVDYLNENNSNIGRIDWVNSRTDVTINFKKELIEIITKIVKEYPEIGLDFDPIIDAQDRPEKFKIDIKDSDYLIVKGTDWPTFRLILKLNFELDEWLVDGSGIVNIPIDKQINR